MSAGSDGPSRWRRWVPPALWALLILVATSWPNPDPPDVGPHSDKVTHLVLYGVLAFLLGRADPLLSAGSLRILAAIAGVSAFAAVDEWHQRFVPGRSASVADWQADTAGAVLGFLLVAALRRRSTPA